MSSNGKKVFIVDDEMDVRSLLKWTLVEAGYDIAEAADAIGLVERVSAEAPDLVLLDLTMPDVSGFDALDQLKSDSRTAEIPVIVVSAQARREVLVRARDLKAADFIIKPWEDGEVEWRVGHVLGLIEEAA